jgi:hypothetical protein
MTKEAPSSKSPIVGPLIALFLAYVVLSWGAEVTLSWDPSESFGVVGYDVYYGAGSQDYTNSVSAGNVTTVTVSNLVQGVKYFFAATALDGSGDESDFSNEAVATAGATNTPPVRHAVIVYQTFRVTTNLVTWTWLTNQVAVFSNAPEQMFLKAGPIGFTRFVQ